MKRSILLLVGITLCAMGFSTNPLPNVWINEIHYDNAGGDLNEALEIVFENAADYNLSLLKIEFYNGSNGSVYKTISLGDSVACSEVGAYSFFWIRVSGIQNGAPDGFALSYEDHLIQFISYEGTVDADGGAADGQTSVDIAVEEGGDTEIGLSLQLSGTGNVYADYTWKEPATSTFCSLNNEQSFLTTHLKEATETKSRIFVRNGDLIIQSSRNQQMALFDLTGRCLMQADLHKGENSIAVSFKGICIVKTDSSIEKIVLR